MDRGTMDLLDQAETLTRASTRGVDSDDDIFGFGQHAVSGAFPCLHLQQKRSAVSRVCRRRRAGQGCQARAQRLFRKSTPLSHIVAQRNSPTLQNRNGGGVVGWVRGEELARRQTVGWPQSMECDP